MLALATVATIGLTSAAFAETTPSMKDVHAAQSQASVTHKQNVSLASAARRSLSLTVTRTTGPLHARRIIATVLARSTTPCMWSPKRPFARRRPRKNSLKGFAAGEVKFSTEGSLALGARPTGEIVAGARP